MQFDPKWSPPEIELQPWEDLLLKTAEFMEKNEWCQGRLHTAKHGHDAYCALGAMQMIEYGMINSGIGLWEQHTPALKKAAEKFIEMTRKTIWSWNDFECVTKQQIISKLREVAVNAV